MSSGRSPGLEPWSAGAPSRLFPARTQMGSHRLPGDPSRASALLSDPGRIGRPGHRGLPDAAPVIARTKASALMTCRGSITRLQRPLSTLHERRRRRPCKTRFRLAGSASTGGDLNPLGHVERFLVIPFSFPGLRLSLCNLSNFAHCGRRDLGAGTGLSLRPRRLTLGLIVPATEVHDDEMRPKIVISSRISEMPIYKISV